MTQEAAPQIRTLHVRCYYPRPMDNKITCLTVDSGVEKAAAIDFKEMIKFSKSHCSIPPDRLLCLVPKELV